MSAIFTAADAHEVYKERKDKQFGHVVASIESALKTEILADKSCRNPFLVNVLIPSFLAPTQVTQDCVKQILSGHGWDLTHVSVIQIPDCQTVWQCTVDFLCDG